MKKKRRLAEVVLEALMLVTTVIYPGLMAMLSAAGWMHNVREGAYPEVFRSFAGWMYAGAGLVCIGAVLAAVSRRPKRWPLAAAAIVCAAIGAAACMSSLYRFCAYADRHFPGIRDTMQPVSELYRDRLLPVLFPAALAVCLGTWHLFSEESRSYRSERRAARLAAENAEAPKIVE